MSKTLRGLILFSKSEGACTEEDYSVLRLLRASRAREIDTKIVRPEQFELIITRSDKKSILIDDVPEPLPDFVIPRLGSDTTLLRFFRY